MKTDRNPVVVKGLRVAFGKRRVLDGLDFELRRGSATALVGDNAAGKSTLLRVLIGRLVPDAGSVEVLGLAARSTGLCRGSHRATQLDESGRLAEIQRALLSDLEYDRAGAPVRAARA